MPALFAYLLICVLSLGVCVMPSCMVAEQAAECEVEQVECTVSIAEEKLLRPSRRQKHFEPHGGSHSYQSGCTKANLRSVVASPNGFLVSTQSKRNGFGGHLIA